MDGGQDSKADAADARMGMIQVNDLIYKLDPDLSVAVARTHKSQFFQNNTYSDAQTSICILNSGADYIDPRRSWLEFEIIVPATNRLGLTSDNVNSLISFYFGATGSVLNLVDSVVVSTRSGDEVSRVNDYGQMMNIMLPLLFGVDWRNSVAQQIGLGSFLGGVQVPVDTYPTQASEMRRRMFQIPLYLLAPPFMYGRLLPSMFMSGLRIEIKWKPLLQATQLFWENLLTHFPVDGIGQTNTAAQYVSGQGVDTSTHREFNTNFKTYLTAGTAFSGGGGVSAAYSVNTIWSFTFTNRELNTNWPGPPDNFAAPGFNDLARRGLLRHGTIIVLPVNGAAVTPGTNDGQAFFLPEDNLIFYVEEIKDNNTVIVNTDFPADFGGFVPSAQGGAYLLNSTRENGYTRGFGSLYLEGKLATPATPVNLASSNYTIQQPTIQMCCIQLTDAVQRTLNEFSSVQGLEIVYADYDRTSTPFTSGVNSVYTEVRKSASRALCVFSRLVRSSTDGFTYDGFASMYQSFWNKYQYQLGSLYFPQQQVSDNNSDPDIRRDNMLSKEYNYTLDAFDRLHPKAPPTMLSLRGHGLDWQSIYLHPTEVFRNHDQDPYLCPPANNGKWGSFANGATTIATTLERSTLFDLSGVPINNSRVLALRGEIDIPQVNNQNVSATLFVFLKYVRLCRVFLINAEVEQ